MAPSNYDVYLGIGSVSRRVRTTLTTSIYDNADVIYADTRYENFGGADVLPYSNYSTNMHIGNDILNINFYYSYLNPGDIKSFQYVHVVNKLQQDQSLQQLSSLLLTLSLIHI